MCKLTKKLFEIVNQIPDDMETITLNDLRQIKDGIISYRLEKGEAISQSILDHNYVSIALTTIPNGCHFPEHVHINPINELLIVLNGKLRMKINNEIREYKEGELVIINSNVKHDATAVGDATFVAITIPKDEGFPQRTG